jgi:hypothetical protein
MSDKPDRAFNNPELDSIGFLEAVMRDSAVPLELRAKAAELLLPYTESPVQRLTLFPVKDKDCTITIRLSSLYGDDETTKTEEVAGHA